MRPADEDDLAEAVRSATAPLRIRGGGTRAVGRTTAGRVLDLSGLTGITHYAPGALTLSARAGTPLAEVEATLAGERQRLPFEPADWRGLLGTSGEPTIGGVVAANVSGPRRVQAGAARDSLIGIRFVDGTGTVIRNGGRTMKNVTGYDLVKLVAGSWGTLGALSEVTFKVLPAPGSAETLVLPDDGPAGAVAAMASALTSPFDVTGAAWLPETGTLIRVEGFAQSVEYRAGRLAERLAGFGAARRVRDRAEGAALWAAVREVAPFHGRAGDLWRFSVPPGDAPALVGRLGGEAILDWGGGLVWALLPPGTDARSQAGTFRGHATLMRAGTADHPAPAFQPEAPALAALARGLRARFDPRGLFNPGLMD